MFLKEIEVADLTGGIGTFRSKDKEGSLEISFVRAKCASGRDAKNVTAVTMSQPVVTPPRALAPPTGVDNRYVTAVTYLCELRYVS